MQETGRLIGASFALTGFSVAVIAGLMAGNPSLTIITRALIALLVCRAVGGFLGFLGEAVARSAAADLALETGAIQEVPAQQADAAPGSGPSEIRNAA